MKNYLLIFFISATFSTLAQDVKIDDLSLISEKSINFKNNVAKLKVRLWNKSKLSLNYLSMSCSWEKFYIVDNNDINILAKSCDKNVPQIITLKPNESKIVELEIQALTTNIKEFKLGILIIQTTELIVPSQEFILKNSEVVWCSSIYPRN